MEGARGQPGVEGTGEWTWGKAQAASSACSRSPAEEALGEHNMAKSSPSFKEVGNLDLYYKPSCFKYCRCISEGELKQ